jgi:hypothetical protein
MSKPGSSGSPFAGKFWPRPQRCAGAALRQASTRVESSEGDMAFNATSRSVRSSDIIINTTSRSASGVNLGICGELCRNLGDGVI